MSLRQIQELTDSQRTSTEKAKVNGKMKHFALFAFVMQIYMKKDQLV